MRRLALIAGLAATTACGHSRPPAEVSPLAVLIERRPDPGDPTIGLQEAIPSSTIPATTTTTLDQQRVSAPKSSRHAAHTRPGPSAPRAGGAAPLACIRAHESDTSGGYRAVSPNGRWFGAYQFTIDTWRGAVARAGYPEHADTRPDRAPAAVQDAAARQLFAERGVQPWPPARGCA